MSLFNFNDPLTKKLSTLAEEILTEKVVAEDEVTDEDAGDFTIAAAAAKKAGKKKFKFGGKEYPVTIKSDIKTEEAEALEELTAAEKKLIDQMYDKKGNLTPLGKKVMDHGKAASKLTPKDKDADNARRKDYKAYQKANRNEEVELDEAMKITHVVIDTADDDKVVSMASDEKGAKSSIVSAERPPMSIKDKKTLKVVKLKKPAGQKAADRLIGYPLKEEDLQEYGYIKSNYTVKHKTFSSAIQHAVEVAAKKGYEVDPDDYDRKVAMGPKKPSSGKTNSYSIKLSKNGKEQKKALQVQIANLDNKFYELNMYIQ
jgi:hypothetical protein